MFENEHSRAVNKLSFHPKEPNILLSGSQDSTMKIFVRSIHTYDVHVHVYTHGLDKNFQGEQTNVSRNRGGS